MKSNVVPEPGAEMDIKENDLVPVVDWNEIGHCEHFVQFYDQDEYLISSVGQFVQAGLVAGGSAVIIATPAHRAALEAYLRGLGVDVLMHTMVGCYLALDAAETLAAFMVDGMPDPARFMDTITPVISRAGRQGRPIRAFGEMVALLCAEGNNLAAIRLEELWNELAVLHKFSLFCAYPMKNFAGKDASVSFRHICKTHARVIPTESYTGMPDREERLRCISLLQQTASCVEEETTGREHAEARLREEHARLSAAVALAELGTWELDLQSERFEASVRCREHLGVTGQPLDLDAVLGRVHPHDRPMVEEAFRAAMRDGNRCALEFRVSTPAEPRWISCLGHVESQGRRVMTGVTLEITSRKSTVDSLESVVEAKTVQLRETIAELEAFSYSVSHDLRTPLRAVQSYAEILGQEAADMLDPQCRHYLGRITTAAGRMDRLIQDILSFSQVNRAEFVPEPVDIDRLTRTIVDMTPSLQHPQATVLIKGVLPRVMGNPAALTQCLSNLLANAVKFVAPNVRPQVRIWSETGSEPGHVRVNVQDNGIGIPAESQQLIFGVFQRLNKNYEGTGIGLSIVERAMSRMGGRVGVTSHEGRGSTFWLELKVASE